ncbi:MAG: hypothetical protein OSB57_11430 [Planctomycetota bacterium]|nr:hypothetical protein [Planctomycetota bacterium]
MSIIIGFDPGKSGGLVALSSEGAYLRHHRITVIGSGSRARIDGRAIADWLAKIYAAWPDDVIVVAERVSSMPTDGVVSAFSFGKALGQVVGITEALGFPFTEVAPTDWQKLMLRGHKRTPRKVRKANCALVAGDLFPELAELLRVKANWGLADAALIGEFHRRMTLRKP